ncbi:RagB/SusD family nutrient uptake outer membrane protein [Longitalea luteola]|uniref:RagB/SusD family nutrient uptake outer membrane protein n=1 Tax=Longitalea luteola TaxID=2812563 RepID=UPI001A95D8E9|nr:RagB/SusD family nutrient uptake outer membrane protein [Longitalea luteola]
MKKTINISKYLLAIGIAVAGSGCTKTSDFLNLKDREGIDAAIWEQEGAVQYLLNETYDMIMPDFTYQYTANNYNIHLVSDENFFSATDNWGKKVFNFNGALIANDPRYIASKYAGNNIGENRYFDVAKCNLAIVNLPGSKNIPEQSKKAMLGQFYTLRAMLYFNLTRYYGGVPLLLEPQSPSNLTLQGRVKAKGMFEQIISDLDAAIENLDGVTYNAGTEWGKLTKAAAAALKAKALIYWASPQFNPENDPNHPYEAQRWQTAHQAAKDAYDICVAAGHALQSDYATIFQIEGNTNKEAIIVKSYSPTHLKRNHNVEGMCRPQSEGGSPSDVYYASNRMIEAYTMKDGRPITEANTGYDGTMFWLNRDPRFEATIAYNGSTWKLSGKNNRRQWTYIGAADERGDRGFYCKRFSSPNLSRENAPKAGDFGGSGMDWIELRFAEVILNYAETANETGNLSLSKDLVRQIRKRAGIIEGSFDYGLSLANTKEQMRDLIMNERMVEFAFEGKRHDDLRRTRRMHKLTGLLESTQFDLVNSGDKAFLEKVIDANTGLRNRDTIDMTNKATVTRFFRTKTHSVTNNSGFSMPEHYYFMPLHNQFINSSPLLEQTIGWEGGTFDPL